MNKTILYYIMDLIGQSIGALLEAKDVRLKILEMNNAMARAEIETLHNFIRQNNIHYLREELERAKNEIETYSVALEIAAREAAELKVVTNNIGRCKVTKIETPTMIIERDSDETIRLWRDGRVSITLPGDSVINYSRRNIELNIGGDKREFIITRSLMITEVVEDGFLEWGAHKSIIISPRGDEITIAAALIVIKNAAGKRLFFANDGGDISDVLVPVDCNTALKLTDGCFRFVKCDIK